MAKRGLVFAAVLFLCALATRAGAAEVVLAECDWDTATGSVYGKTFYTNYYMLQTFTTTAAGTVGSVDVTIVQTNSNTTSDITAKIYALTFRSGSLQPTGDPLSTGILDATDPQLDNIMAAWKHISMSPAALDGNSTYGLVIYAGGTNADYNWITKDNDADLYNAGEFSISTDGVNFGIQPGDDVCFRILTPEPATMAILLATGAGLLMRRRAAR